MSERGGEPKRALPNFRDVNLSVGSFLANLEQTILNNRPPPAIVVEEEARGELMTADGQLIDDIPLDPADRPEPADTTGARL